MKIIIKYYLLGMTILFCHSILFAQNKSIDSILILLKTDKLDTNKVIHSCKLCWEYTNIDLHDSAIYHGNAALFLAKQINFPKGISNSYSCIGNVYLRQADYPKALDYYFKALKIDEELKHENGMTKRLNSIGLVYNIQGDYKKALDYHLSALKMAKKLNDKQLQSTTFESIGDVYWGQNNFSKALNYYFQKLKIAEELADKQLQASTFHKIAGVYNSLNDSGNALSFSFKALKIDSEIGDKNKVSEDLYYIGNIYASNNNYPKVLDYYFQALKAAEESGNKRLIATRLGNIGGIYTETRNLKKAEEYLQKSLKLSNEINNFYVVYQLNEMLSDLYIQTNEPIKALEYYKKYIEVRDSIFSKENEEKILKAHMYYEFDKKEAAAKAQQDIKDTINMEEKQKQKAIIYVVSVSLFLVISLALFIFKGYRQKQKANAIIIEQKNEVEKSKYIIEEKHKEITDSINYAKRIQGSFLATKEILDENLKEYFVFFKPKDVVSGDFYWAEKLSNGNFILATADSTGHGVPGAIMSLLNITSLEKACERYTKPDDILNNTRQTIITRLKKDGSIEGGKDGMDCSLLVFDFAIKKLRIAAANNPVWIIREEETIEVKPDKMPVGKHDKQEISFTQQEFDIQNGDIIYTLTDGFPDQFGGPKGKKFMSKNLRELLIKNSHLSMNAQKILLENAFTNWIGNLEQIDDVTVVGVRI